MVPPPMPPPPLPPEASRWRRLLAWTIDQVLLLVACFGLLVVLVTTVDPTDAQMVFLLLGVLFGVPLVYGALCFRARTLGCLVAGTAFFHTDARRRATWGGTMRTVMLRWWLPVLGIIVVMSILSLDGDAGWESAHESRRVR